MALFSSRDVGHLRLAPELDDMELGRLLRKLKVRPMGGLEMEAARISAFLEKTGGDWDRRSHRLSVLARVTADYGIAAVWLRREPNSADALVFHSWVRVVQGLRARRLEDPAQLTAHCHKAADLRPEDPSPWVVLLAAARIERYGFTYVNGIWGAVTGRDRWHREAYHQMLGYLSPEEGGSRFQVLDFVDAVRSRAPADAPCAAVELTALVQQYQGLVRQGGLRAITARDLWSQGSTPEVLGRAGARWPKPGYLRHAAAMADLNALAYALCAAGRGREATAVFDALKGTVTDWPWGLAGEALTEFEQQQDKSRHLGS
ncbi:hypothetical protein H3146_11370 [Streptomyces sp. OF3]|uniref:DUF4034 domain-containing protein n=1 Tax=Streptomyces alkaliterrae TaxID=2213162 RepID=A0A7W3ZMX3_9ACTN|nr:hypothetical protein [Streptomyces alkaliterrae]MBB1253960.1 hypothetical protein [Streptomyces alkaliterrae]